MGHYRIVEKIGAGGMGEVYRAHDEHLQCDVAVKVLPEGALGDEDSRKRFRREALALSKLNHPNIEVAHDFDTADGIDYLVMEYIVGRTLDVVVASRLSEREVLHLGAQLAEGLAAAHEQGVVHRDLKPPNLLVTADFRLKILDFGLAKVVHKPSPQAPTESLTLTDGTVGTLPYMAPEQLQWGRADRRSDIWAAGAVLYEMITLRRPFPGSGVQLADAIRYQAPLPPSRVNPGVSPGLEAVIFRCLEKDPDDRYQSASELALHLRRLERGETLPHVLLPRARFSRRARRGVALLAGLLAVSMALLAVVPVRQRVAAWLPSPWRRLLIGPPAPLTEKDLVLVTEFRNGPEDPVFEATLRKAVALDLDQSPYVNVVSDRRIAEGLKRMGRDPEEKLTPELGTELCQRDGIKAMLVGSLDKIGGSYILGMQVLDASTGEVMTEVRRTGTQQQILAMVDQATSKLREQLGESLASIQRFEKPLPEATTTSLEALRAFALGDRKHFSASEIEAIGLYKHALELDPDFALAWARLAVVYENLGDKPDAADAARRAYALKDKVSERERLYILASDSDLTERRAMLEIYRSTYPRDYIPYLYLSQIDSPADAEKDLLRTLELDPDVAVAYGDLASVYAARGDRSGAMDLCRQGLRRIGRAPLLAAQCYEVALAAQDQSGLQEMAANLKAGTEGQAFLAEMQRDLAFARGQVAQSLARNDQMLAALSTTPLPSLVLSKLLPYDRMQSAAGYPVGVSQQIQAYPGLAAESLPAVLALAEAGEVGAAQRIRAKALQGAGDLYGRYLDALLADRSGQRQRALALLSGSGQVDDPFVLWYRGNLYLRAGRLDAASSDFMRLLAGATPDAPLYPWAAFSHIGLARCSAAGGDRHQARAEYEKAFAQWKDADADVPLLRQARVEYGRLQ